MVLLPVLCACARCDANPPTRTEPVPTSSEASEKTAGEIRQVVAEYLRTSHGEAKRRLPPDFAPALPNEVGPVEQDAEGHLRLGSWLLDLAGETARLDYYPPGAITDTRRIWFRIKLLRQPGGWEIVPPGVGLVHAWARKQN
jgi:hypothetical protein